MGKSFLRIFTILIGIPILIWVTFRVTATPRGQLCASYDIWRGHYEIKKYGLIRIPLPIYSRILKERYNIICPSSASCMVTDGEVAFKNAYNAISTPAIIKHFGKDVFAEAKIEAEAEFRNTLPK